MNVLEHLEGLVSGKIETMKGIVSLFKLEARLASLSVFPLLLNLIGLFVILTTTWICTMVLIGTMLMLLFTSIIPAVALVLLLNLMIFIGLGYCIKTNLKNMSFVKTRDYFSPKEPHNGQLTTTTDQ